MGSNKGNQSGSIFTLSELDLLAELSIDFINKRVSKRLEPSKAPSPNVAPHQIDLEKEVQ